MNVQLIGLLIACAITFVIVVPLKTALWRHAGAFYLGAIALTVVYIWAIQTHARLTPIYVLTIILQKGYLSSLLLAIVMFTGCLNEGSAVRKWLQPIRAELSILSFIFIVGHVFSYLPGYLGRFGVLFATRPHVAASLVIATALTVLFLILSVTSLRVVRRAMKARVWKNIQRFAYLMVVLLAVHICFVLGRSALSGSGGLQASITLSVYIAAVAIYGILRIRKALRDCQKKTVTAA